MRYPGAKGCPPSAQYMGDGGIGERGPVRGMGVVHGDDIGDEIDIADIPGEISHRGKPAGSLDQKRGMIELSDAHGVDWHRIGEGRLVQGMDPRDVSK